MLQVLFQSEFPTENTENSINRLAKKIIQGPVVFVRTLPQNSKLRISSPVFASTVCGVFRFLYCGSLGDLFGILFRKIGAVGNNKSKVI